MRFRRSLVQRKVYRSGRMPCKDKKVSDGRLNAMAQMERFIEKYSLNWTGLALVLGKSLAAISQWKAGRSYPDQTSVNLMCVLEVSHEAREAAGVYRWRLKRKRNSKSKPESAPRTPRATATKAPSDLPAPPKPAKEGQKVAPRAETAPPSAHFDVEKFLEGSMDMWD
jgi:DNA-binding transcriptional regulator YiaG